MNTIKELDKQMTEMAVVTNLEVGDYWKQLPEHTERANALGMAIKDVYEAETLYYQQGLKTAQVTELSTSTLKMARIAGLSAEDATNKMTAALRGFNMEINQTNADRIADVYSKLAAITASNVREISTAMTKTASLAANAGMEFETTAAFLSQIIETTRESAETAGTALKTVIARFQELKKAPEEIGEVDGEIVDANKIETALRTVGVALRDAQGQFRELDDVFMELAGKWDSLDTNTQRYIATIAAGSRQQSRFIAMMSNYSRTQELVTAANSAAGASNEQFEKTLDSLASKLAALKNAWDSFTMGLANNEFIKIAVDLITGLVNAINKVTEGFGPWSSSALKIGLVTAALIAGDKALKAFMTTFNKSHSILKSFGAGVSAPVKSLKNFITGLTGGSKALKDYAKALADQKAK
jgi:TP901 family phage tail tape measure protein